MHEALGSVTGTIYTLPLCCQMKTWIELCLPILQRCVDLGSIGKNV